MEPPSSISGGGSRKADFGVKAHLKVRNELLHQVETMEVVPVGYYANPRKSLHFGGSKGSCGEKRLITPDSFGN